MTDGEVFWVLFLASMFLSMFWMLMAILQQIHRMEHRDRSGE